ncbi:helix-turn-helix domain-containing protein [Methanosarcina sp. MTP4]
MAGGRRKPSTSQCIFILTQRILTVKMYINMMLKAYKFRLYPTAELKG